jgi:tyrosine-protein phosphatase YwqE
MQDLKPVMALGCLFQVNIISLTGYYGSVVQGLSQKLVRNNMVAYLGTELRTLKQAFALDRALHKPAVVTSITQQTFRNASL